MNNNSSSGNTGYIGKWITIPINIGKFTKSIIDKGAACDSGVSKIKQDGCNCKKCKTYYEFAEPNQEDGTLICWACRNNH